MTILNDNTRKILISFWCDFFPESPCSMVQELCDYAEDNDLELNSIETYMMCLYDFKSKHINK